MSNDIKREIAQLARWLDEQCCRHKYGTFGITATVHAGRITRIERHAQESVKPQKANVEPMRDSARLETDVPPWGAVE